MADALFGGCGVALVTPFLDDGQLDRDALARMVEHVIDGGCDFVVALGTTGEAVGQSRRECIEVMHLIHELVGERVPLVAGPFGANTTAGLVERLRDYKSVLDLPGYVTVMSSVPSYVKPNQRGIYQHFLTVAEASPLPVLLYNVPGRTGVHMTAATTVALARDAANIMGVKEASGDLAEGALLLRDRPAGFSVFSGDDPTALPLMSLGAEGVISVVANAYPDVFSGMTAQALAGDFRKARRGHNLLLDLHPLLYRDGNPSGIKAVLAHLGLCGEHVRLPIAGVTEATAAGIRDVVLRIESERSPALA